MRNIQIDDHILANALRCVNEGICITDLEDRFLFVNQSFVEMYGYSEDELIGRHIAMLRGPGDLAGKSGAILAVTTREGVWRGELVNMHKDGSLFEVRVTTSIIRDDAGQPVAILGVTSDISHQRAAERALRESEERYRVVTDQTGQLIYDYNIQTGDISWFGSVSNLLGFTSAEMNQGGISFWNDLIHPDDREEIVRQLEHAINFHTSFHAEYRFRCKNGQYKNFQDNGILESNPEQRAVRMLGTMSDITLQKTMLKKTRAVAELFRKLGTDSGMNIQSVVSLACDVVEGLASLYNRLDDKRFSLVVWAGHNLPVDMPGEDQPMGHICYEATMKSSDQPVVLGDLSGTSFEESDPNVLQYGLKAYLGAPVMIGDRIIGALAVVDAKTRQFTQDEIDLITILARAISLEEERLEANTIMSAAIEQSPSGILIATAPDVRIRMANSVAHLILTGEPGMIIGNHGTLHIKRTWKAFRTDGSYYPVDEMPLTRAIKHGEITTNEEILIENEHGKRYYVLTNAAPIRNRSGTITSAIVIFHDVSDRKRAEESLRGKARDLERFNNLMVGREIKMIELKREVNHLMVRLGQPGKYVIHEALGEELM